MKYGLLFRKESWWIGIHWSSYNKRLCINIIPMLTVWFAAHDGQVPNQGLHLMKKTSRSTVYCRARIHGGNNYSHEF